MRSNHELIETCINGLSNLHEMFDENMEARTFIENEIKDALSNIQEHLSVILNTTSNNDIEGSKSTLSAMTALLKEILMVGYYFELFIC